MASIKSQAKHAGRRALSFFLSASLDFALHISMRNRMGCTGGLSPPPAICDRHRPRRYGAVWYPGNSDRSEPRPAFPGHTCRVPRARNIGATERKDLEY